MKVRIYFLLAVMAAFAGCTTVERAPDEIAAQDPEALFVAGQYENAAAMFLERARQASGHERTALQLRAAAALARANQTHQSRQLLETTTIVAGDQINVSLQRLARAHLALTERQPAQVQTLLSEPLAQGIPARYLAEFHELRAATFTMLGNRLDSARELVERGKYLDAPAVIKANQEAIWAALASMTERALQQLRTAPPPDTLSGWMELVQIAKVYQLSPLRLKEQIVNWQDRYPGHPVADEILNALLERKAEDVAYPDRIALILPLSGRFASAGEALRDGFIAAYYTRRPAAGQIIRIYDAGEDIAQINTIYQRAIDDGADFVVGPLDKDSVQLLSQQRDEFPVPTLALNYLPEQEQSIRSNLFQFGLSPEEEARQVAERTWLDGHVNAAALVPAGPWGERIQEAFRERWERMGGKIVSVQTYDTNKTDFAQPIQALLNINDSQRRYRSVANILKREIKFTERRRQDIDFIFLAAYPRQARQIRPQLKYYHASDLPVYSTSHVFTGVLNQERDRDMDGLVFGDMPWVLVESTAHRGLRAEIENQITDAGNALQRLYALGIDAFNIIGALNTLRNYPYERFDGETGSLSLDNNSRIRRQLTWVRFRSGRPAAVDAGNI